MTHTARTHTHTHHTRRLCTDTLTNSRAPHANIRTPRGTTSFPEDIQAHSAPLMWPLLHQRKSSAVGDSAEIYFG